jgi:hypothetical protein
MVKKRHWGQYPSLFEFDSDPALVPENRVSHATEGDQHAVQDHSPGTSEGKPGVARRTASDAPAAADAGNLGEGTKGRPRELEADARQGEAGERAEPARERGSGNGSEKVGGSCTVGASSGRAGTALAGKGNGVRPKSYLERLRASQRETSLFDVRPEFIATDTRAPPESPRATREPAAVTPEATHPKVIFASGDNAKARDIIAAIRVLKRIEEEQRSATAQGKESLARFCGFGPVALSIFPDPVTGKYKSAGWQALGEELVALLTPAEYDSAKRTTFNAFYTSPAVITAIHDGIARLGLPTDATILEPGCGTGNFMSYGRPGSHFIGIELDSISGWIAKAIHPDQDIRIENFRDTRLPVDRIDAVVGNVPFTAFTIPRTPPGMAKSGASGAGIAVNKPTISALMRAES